MDAPATPVLAVGADGARGGWAAACLHADSADTKRASTWTTRLHIFEPPFAELGAYRARHAPTATVAVDIPIGLPDTLEYRPCDRAARGLLGRRASCVFMPPARFLLAADDYPAVKKLVDEERWRHPGTRGFSAQAAAIIPKVREVDEWVREHPESEEWLWECHPELSFYTLNGDAPAAPKRSAAGPIARLQLLRPLFPDIEDQLAATPWPASKVDLSDLLDAYAALATAIRCALGEHEELGDGARDSAGLPMRMAL